MHSMKVDLQAQMEAQIEKWADKEGLRLRIQVTKSSNHRKQPWFTWESILECGLPFSSHRSNRELLEDK